VAITKHLVIFTKYNRGVLKGLVNFLKYNKNVLRQPVNFLKCNRAVTKRLEPLTKYLVIIKAAAPGRPSVVFLPGQHISTPFRRILYLFSPLYRGESSQPT
jgi:hypothetical protein